ncbi:Uncharacterized protein HZ326_6562 [Fusarium oxysporum f. sp. albedinis]|nr:Uncharacterized protein HZ326_6562 [Fusarium oxysporum f. sp. albedinis]
MNKYSRPGKAPTTDELNEAKRAKPSVRGLLVACYPWHIAMIGEAEKLAKYLHLCESFFSPVFPFRISIASCISL